MPANVVVPEVGESIVDARVARWLKREGDSVTAGEPLVELETDKIDLEVSSPQAGVLGRIAHGDGADVKVGEVLAVIEEARDQRTEDGGRRTEDGKQPAAGSGAPQGAPLAEAAPAAKADGSGKPEAADKTRATPAARKAAQQNDVDLKTVQGSGDAGRVMRRDVEAVAKSDVSAVARSAKVDARPLAPVREERRHNGDPRTEERVRMSKRRATIAKRLVEAQSTAAMLTTFNEVDMSAIQAVRERHKQAFKDRHGVGLGLVVLRRRSSARCASSRA
jgi:2-oxoglutarate dehydrogenase E2 component (dihydrolipoamide succinyltransferase)